MQSIDIRAGLQLLSVADRRWLQSQLDPQERQRLATLMRVSPGAGSEEELSTQARVAADATRLKSERSSVLDDLNLLSAASAAEVLPLVGELPPGAVALILSANSWAWGTAVREGLAESIRAHLAMLSQNSSTIAANHALRDLIIEELARALRHKRSSLAAPGRRFEALVSGAV